MHSRLVVRRHVWEPDKEQHGLPYLEILKGWLKDSILAHELQSYLLVSQNAHSKEF